MKGTEEIGCCGAYCGTCREYQKTCRAAESGVSRRLPGFEPSQMQDEEMLPDQRSHHLRRLRGI